MALTPKQMAFADYYIECGNATEAAKRAGYKAKNAGTNAGKLLKNANVSAYIRERTAAAARKRVADATEVIEFYTAVMRGEVKDQFGLDASLTDRLRAGNSLMKRYAVGGGRQSTVKKEDDPLTKALKKEAERLDDGNF